MRGPFLLRPAQVDMTVPCRLGGVYCLGKDSRHVAAVGRAERNLRTALKDCWKDDKYQFFWYEPTMSARECYVNHCRHFHNHISNGGLDDIAHPEPPPGLDEKCPVCGK